MEGPLVSIVLPTYNCEEYLGQAIDSILAQTYTNWELIVVDDASTDATAQLLQSYDDPRIRVIRNARNEQTYFSCNVGLSHCRGSYIAIEDSDDLWLPDKLEKQLAWLETHPACDACFTLADIIDENGKIISEARPELYRTYTPENRAREQWLHDLLLHDNCLCHSSVVFRSRVIAEAGPYNVSLRQLADYEMWLRVLLYGDIHVLQEKLTRVRRPDEGSSVSTPSETVLKRDGIEKCTVIPDIIDRMDDEIFLRAFAGELRDPGAAGHTAALCEKAFLKLGHFIYDPIRLSGCRDLIRLFSEPEGADMLREGYGFSQKALYARISEKDFPEAGVPYITEIFWDTGTGFSQDNVSTFLFGAKALSSIEFDVAVPDGARALRFDPVPDAGCIVSGLRLECGGETLTLRDTNGREFRGTYRFDGDDPQFVYALPDGIGRVLDISAKIAVSPEMCRLLDEAQRRGENDRAQIVALQGETGCLRQLIADQQTQLDSHSALIRKMQNKSEQRQSRGDALEQELAVVRAENARLSYDYNVISNSEFWKITKPMRKLLDSFKRTALGGFLYRFFWNLKHRGIDAAAVGMELFPHRRRKLTHSIVFTTPFVELIKDDVSNTDVLPALDEEFVRAPEQKKVLFFSHEMTLTGAPLVLMNFAKAAQKQGWYAVIAAPSDGPLRAEAEKAGIPMLIVPGLLQKPYLYEMCYPFNLVVACTIVSAPVIKALDGSDIPVLWWIHEALASYHGGAVKELPTSLSDNIHVYCVCDYAEKCMKTYRPYRFDGLLPYYMEEFSAGGDSGFCLPEADGKLTFALVGTMEYRKGHDILAAAIRKLPDEVREKCLFVIVSKRFHQPFKVLIDELCRDFPENVLYYEQLGRDEIGVLYENCDCLICASRDDPLPCVITEALSLGKPAVSTEHTGYASILREMGSGLLYGDDDPVKLEECIERFVTDAELRERLASRARETYEKYFSEGVFEENVSRILNRLVYKLRDEELKDENGRGNIPFKKPRASVSVVIPAWQPGDGYDALLTALEEQKGLEKLEIVVVDSGSDEKYTDIAKKHGVTLIQIPNSEFSHSGARNLGAREASGDILLFMTQDAFPISERWIARLIAPILNGTAAAVSPLEKCPEGTDLYYRVASSLHADYLGTASKDRTNAGIGTGDRSAYRRRAALNDVTTAVSRQVFLRFGYRYNFAEDLDLGMRLLRGGYSVSLLNSVHTLHGHNRAAGYYLKRSLVDTVSTNQDILGTPIEGTAMSMEVCGMLIQGWGAFRRLYSQMLPNCGLGFREFTAKLEDGFAALTALPAGEASAVCESAEDTDPVLLRAAQLMRERAGEQSVRRYEATNALQGYYTAVLKPYLRKLPWNGETALAALNCLEKQLATIIGCELARVGRDDPFYPMLDEFRKGV